MAQKHQDTALWLAALLALAGCATVNPRLDYQQAAEHVRQATGQEWIYQPGDEEIVERKVGGSRSDSPSDGLDNKPDCTTSALARPMLKNAACSRGLFKRQTCTASSAVRPSARSSPTFLSTISSSPGW